MCVIGVSHGPGLGSSNAAATSPKPNFVLVLTDDQRWDSIGRCMPSVDATDLHAGANACMPNVQQDLIANGVTFQRGYVTTSLCCPSRSSILTGLYAQHHGVMDNHGFPEFVDSSTIATWLDPTYRTGLFGKYLNDYGEVAPLNYVPPGWDNWHAFYGPMGGDRGYKKYTLIQKDDAAAPVITDFDYANALDHLPCSVGDYYSTDHLCGLAVDFLQQDTTSPFLLYFAPFGPHKPYIYAPRHSLRFGGVAQPVYPNSNQVPMPNPPSWLPTQPLTSTDLSRVRAGYIAALKTDLSIDDAVGSLYDQLASDGRASNTVWIFLSDNGRAAGEHRYDDGKQCEFEECHRVPFVVACPPAVCPGQAADTLDTSHLALNIDIAPTFADMAGVTPATRVDGRSLVPLLNDSGAVWRTSYLQTDLWGFNQSVLSRGITFDAPDGHTYKYVLLINTNEKELYDLTADPWELSNLAGDGVHTAIEAQLAAAVDAQFSPTVITVTGPQGASNDTTPSFSWTSDSPADFRCWLDGGPAASCGSGTSGALGYGAQAEGSHVFHLEGNDADNNTTTISRSFTIDITPPPSPTFTDTPPNPSGDSVSFSFANTDAPVTFRCSFDAAPPVACVSPVSYVGLTGGGHWLSVSADDAAGNAASSSADYTWVVDPSLDTLAPVVKMNKPAVDALLATTAVAVSWTATDNVGVVRHELSERVGTSGVWSVVKSGNGTTYARVGVPGMTYCYQVRSYDGANNVGVGPERCVGVPLDDADGAISYLGGVTHTTPLGAYQGTLSNLLGSGDEADFAFTGRKVGVLVRKGPDAGFVNIFVDGSLVKSLDLYSGSVKNAVVGFRSALAPGTHTVQVVWSTQKNPSSTGRKDPVDGFVTIS